MLINEVAGKLTTLVKLFLFFASSPKSATVNRDVIDGM
jgi:hypothetical protein